MVEFVGNQTLLSINQDSDAATILYEGISSKQPTATVKTDPILAKIRKTETTHAILYLIGGIALAVLGVVLSLAMVTAIVFLFLSTAGVVAIPTFVAISILVVTGTSLLGGIGGFVALGSKVNGGIFSSGYNFLKSKVGTAHGPILFFALIVVGGIISPAICGIWLLNLANEHLRNLQGVIEKRRIGELIREMDPSLLCKNLDAYVIARLYLESGLDRDEIANLRWDQINLAQGTITLRNQKKDQTATLNWDPGIPLEQYQKLNGTDNALLFPRKDQFARGFNEFVHWMEARGIGADAELVIRRSERTQLGVKERTMVADLGPMAIPPEENKREEIPNLPMLQYIADRTLGQTDPVAHAIFFFYVVIGLEREEIENLKWEQIDAGNWTITVPVNVNENKRGITIELDAGQGYALKRKYYPGAMESRSSKASNRGRDILNSNWRSDGMVFNPDELEKGFSTLAHFLKASGITAESVLENEQFARRENELREVRIWRPIDLSFLS
ncbi:MAG: hypothetical protein LBT98_01895 [Puniceicoccales bacterium]|jgi:integrase|nr:hypothetical protein [Puniceicoccales bacterium]